MIGEASVGALRIWTDGQHGMQRVKDRGVADNGAFDAAAFGGITFVVLVGASISAFVLARRLLAGGITPECHRICRHDAVTKPCLGTLLDVMRLIERGNMAL